MIELDIKEYNLDELEYLKKLCNTLLLHYVMGAVRTYRALNASGTPFRMT